MLCKITLNVFGLYVVVVSCVWPNLDFIYTCNNIIVLPFDSFLKIKIRAAADLGLIAIVWLLQILKSLVQFTITTAIKYVMCNLFWF